MKTDRRAFLKASAMAAAASGVPALSQSAESKHTYEVGAYYFPNWHVDPRNEQIHGKGWTEWRMLQRATPRFPGHRQPKVPLWGYEDESIPSVFEKKIQAAADHGVTYFIFDWYWYEQRPFLNAGLDQGYLGASNNGRVKFCLMWANHDWIDLYPSRLHAPEWMQYPGAVNRSQFDSVTNTIIEKYFTHPSYFKIDDCPYFSVYQLSHLVSALGGVAETAKALESFRRRTQAAGHKDLHLNAVKSGISSGVGSEQANVQQMLQDVSCRSTTSYCWATGPTPKSFPTYDYADAMQLAIPYWDKSASEFPLPYYPNVSMGWDSTPRTCQSDIFTQWQYPYTAVMTENTPERFKQALQAAKQFMDRRGGSQRIMNVNAWNEWTEGSYLEPDVEHKMDYLNAIRDVFSA